jgi:hypothetical protein
MRQPSPSSARINSLARSSEVSSVPGIGEVKATTLPDHLFQDSLPATTAGMGKPPSRTASNGRLSVIGVSPA